MGGEGALNGIDPLAFIEDLGGRIDGMSRRDEIERALGDLEYLMEVLDPELQGPAYKLVEQLRAKLDAALK